MKILEINNLTSEIFINIFQNIFEKTISISVMSEKKRPFRDKEHLILIFMNSFENLDKISKRNIIKNHPDLGNKLKIVNNLTILSKNEQENAGLNKCTPEEYDFFSQNE